MYPLGYDTVWVHEAERERIAWHQKAYVIHSGVYVAWNEVHVGIRSDGCHPCAECCHPLWIRLTEDVAVESVRKVERE